MRSVSLKSRLRSVTAWILFGILSGTVLIPAQEPGTPATAVILRVPRFDLARIAVLPRSASQSDTTPAVSGASASPNKHHIAPWVWAVIVGGVGAGIAAGVIVGNRQSGKTASTPTTATIGTGTGTITAGAP